jgi:hypothetical protein
VCVCFELFTFLFVLLVRYRTWNRFAYERTADINSFIYLGISFSDKRRPYSDIWMCDASGSSPERTQTWANGDKLRITGCVTIHNHFVLEAPMEDWATWSGAEGSDSSNVDSADLSKGLPLTSTRPCKRCVFHSRHHTSLTLQ